MGTHKPDTHGGGLGRKLGEYARCRDCRDEFEPEGPADLRCFKCSYRTRDCAFCGISFVPRNKQHRKFCKTECERAFNAITSRTT